MLELARPRYERLAGWGSDFAGTTDRRGLPEAAQKQLRRIEETVGAQVGMIGIGPERTATIL